MKTNLEQPLTFEEAMSRLEHVVEQLESGEVPLETAIELFQEGMLLSKICGTKLDEVEHKIEILMDENGEMVRKPFTPEGE